MAHLSREEILKSGEVDSDFKKAFEARPSRIVGTDLFAIRVARAEHLFKLRHFHPIPGPIPDEVTETIHNVTVRDGATIRVRVYQPVRGPPQGGSPLIMMYHEGAWCMGDLADEDMNCRMFVRELGVVAVNVEYRLAPEHPFPIGVHDCWDALKWAIFHSPELNATPTKGLIVGGSSAGGNIAAALALLSRDECLQPPITGQYLSVPAVLPHTNVPDHLRHLYTSFTSNVDDPNINTVDLPALLAIYKPEQWSPLWDPFSHPQGHKGVCKAFFQVGGADPLRDGAVLYYWRLIESGVDVRMELYRGYGHLFWVHWPELEESQKFMKDAVAGVRWLLER